jgi:hypothetical protein
MHAKANDRFAFILYRTIAVYDKHGGVYTTQEGPARGEPVRKDGVMIAEGSDARSATVASAAPGEVCYVIRARQPCLNRVDMVESRWWLIRVHREYVEIVYECLCMPRASSERLRAR